MVLAFVVLMPEGVVAYRNHLLLDSLSPIMSHGIKAKKRTIHATLQVSRRQSLGRARRRLLVFVLYRVGYKFVHRRWEALQQGRNAHVMR